MKLLIKHILPILGFAALLYSCIPEDILTHVDAAKSKLVISSQIIPGDDMLVIVTRSFSALEGNEDSLSQDFLDNILVSNAVVSISWDGNKEILEPVEDVAGLYISNLALDENATELRLDVYDPLTEDRVYAITNILPRIKLDSVSFRETVEDSGTTQSIYYGFNEPRDTDNWYVINIFDPKLFIDDFQNNPFAFISGNSGVFYENLISDQTVDTTYYQSDLSFFENEIPSDTIAIFFSNISEGYFRFLDAQQRTGGVLTSATSEPINHPTNIVGGLGYFNAHNPSVLLVEKNQ